MTFYEFVAGHVRVCRGHALGRPDMVRVCRIIKWIFQTAGAPTLQLLREVGNGPIRLAVHVDYQAAPLGGAGYVHDSDDIGEIGIGR